MPRDNVPRTIALLARIDILRQDVAEMPLRADGGLNKWQRELRLAERQYMRIPEHVQRAAEVAIRLGMVH